MRQLETIRLQEVHAAGIELRMGAIAVKNVVAGRAVERCCVVTAEGIGVHLIEPIGPIGVARSRQPRRRGTATNVSSPWES